MRVRKTANRALVRVKTDVAFHEKRFLKFSDLNERRNGSTMFRKTR
jgi:hypothetical protein